MCVCALGLRGGPGNEATMRIQETLLTNEASQWCHGSEHCFLLLTLPLSGHAVSTEQTRVGLSVLEGECATPLFHPAFPRPTVHCTTGRWGEGGYEGEARWGEEKEGVRGKEGKMGGGEGGCEREAREDEGRRRRV